MPLIVEFSVDKENWRQVGVIKPGDQPGSISDLTPQGKNLYIFGCDEGDAASRVTVSRLGLSVDEGPNRAIASIRKELLKVLKEGELPFEATVVTERSPVPVTMRLTHRRYQ